MLEGVTRKGEEEGRWSLWVLFYSQAWFKSRAQYTLGVSRRR